MNEEIDESEFYHQDFTTASEWEIFIARIEQIINQWRTDDLKGESEAVPSQQWFLRTEQLSFVDFEFNLTHYKRQPVADKGEAVNPFNTLHDFVLYDPKTASNDFCLANWYGICEYLVLSPAGNVGITSESRVKLLLSSLYIVISNTACDVPIYVQIREKWQHCYLGAYEIEGVRTNLEMVHLRTGPRHCHYLSGLLDLFRTKIMSPLTILDIIVSVQSTYLLHDFGHAAWKQECFNPDSDGFDGLNTLPFGVTVDPINCLILKTTSSLMPYRSVTDCESYSQFDPISSKKWSILIETTEQPICLLADCLSEFLCLLTNSAVMYDILGDFAVVTPEVSNPLDVLTEPKVPTISSLISRAARNSLPKNRRSSNAPLAEDVLVPILYYLFPDATDDDSSQNGYKDGEQQMGNEPDSESGSFNLEYECRGFKTCVNDSLLWRLSRVLAHALQSFGGLKAFAHVWFEFVQEMRYRWERSITIPGLLPGSPDLRTCLLHQKLQMLNCCIIRQNARDNSTLHFDSAENSSNDDEEFFDCTEDKPEDISKRSKVKHSLWNQPVGRLGKFNDLKLIDTGDFLYIPVTQEPVPKSEDQLEEDTDVLMKLGSDAQGSELRAKMMSVSLLSDMESFKAANPGSILEDFIRWYSPRDWIEKDEELDQWGQKKGELSSRMLIEDNFWIQAWQSAKPVPAHRQKRLFDDTREAEKVLHYLDSRTIAQICELLIPVLSHVAIYKLHEEFESLVSVEMPESPDRLRALIKCAERISRENKLQARRFEGFIQEVTALEVNISQINSLLYKLNPSGGVDENLSTLVADLVTGREIPIEKSNNSTIGNRIQVMFSDAQKSANMILSNNDQNVDDSRNYTGNNSLFPPASEREIVLRVSAPRPASYSAECPQFLRAVLGKNEFRLVGAFSEDTRFF